MTITSLSKFLGLIGYQISLAMVLRWRASARVPLLSRGGGDQSSHFPYPLRVPNRFFGIRDLAHLRTGNRDFREKGEQVLGL